jgi:hypothetical protein
MQCPRILPVVHLCTLGRDMISAILEVYRRTIPDAVEILGNSALYKTHEYQASLWLLQSVRTYVRGIESKSVRENSRFAVFMVIFTFE